MIESPPRSPVPLLARCVALALVALAATYLVFRLREGGFQQNHGVPIYPNAGMDFRAYHLFSGEWLAGRSAYTLDTPTGPNPYPPFFTLFFAPFAMLSVERAYFVFTLISIAAMLVAVYQCLILATGKRSVRDIALPLSVAVAVLAQTYPVIFAWERGTPELLILALITSGLLAMTRGHWLLAAALLAVATHFKLYPLIMGLFLVLRGGPRALGVFLLMVFALFFVLGVAPFVGFYMVLTNALDNSGRWLWLGNHSLRSGAHWLVDHGVLAPESVAVNVARAIGTIIIVTFLVRLTQLWMRRGSRAAGALGLAEVSLVGMAFALMGLIPVFSHDYKLCLHFAPFLMLISSPEAQQIDRDSRAFRALTTVIALAVGIAFAPTLVMPKAWLLLCLFIGYTGVGIVAQRSRATKIGAASS